MLGVEVSFFIRRRGEGCWGWIYYSFLILGSSGFREDNSIYRLGFSMY